MNDIIKDKIESKNFSFMELLQMKKLAVQLATETYDDITTQQKIELIWNADVKGQSFGEIFYELVLNSLSLSFEEGLKELAETATVSFPKPEMPVTPSSESLPPLPMEKAKSPPPIPKSDETIGNDGVGLPKGVKRIH